MKLSLVRHVVAPLNSRVWAHMDQGVGQQLSSLTMGSNLVCLTLSVRLLCPLQML